MLRTTPIAAGTLVYLSRPPRGLAGAFLSIQAIYAFAGAVGFLVALGMALNIGSPVVALIALVAGVAYFIAAYRYLTRSVQAEQLLLAPGTLSVIRVNRLAGRKQTDYDVVAIDRLEYVGYRPTADHPLKGESLDYFGFQTQQRVNDVVNADGNLRFGYHGKEVCFGKDVPSWDAAELSNLIQSITDGRLSIAGLPEEIDEADWKQPWQAAQ